MWDAHFRCAGVIRRAVATVTFSFLIRLGVILFFGGAVRFVFQPAEEQPGVARYVTESPEFALSRLQVDGEALSLRDDGEPGIEIALCTAGRLRVDAGRAGGAIELPRGASCVIPAAAGPYRVLGKGTAYRASVP